MNTGGGTLGRPSMRLAAIAAAVAVLLAPFASLLHFAVERHHWCGVHQAVEHDGDDAQRKAPDRDPGKSPHHDACGVILLGPVDRDPAPAVTHSVAPLVVASAPSLAPTPRVATIATLLIAPKTSPPRA